MSSARVGLPTPEGSLPRGASEGINHGGWLGFTGSQGGKKASPGSKWEVAPCLKVSLSSDGRPFSLLVESSKKKQVAEDGAVPGYKQPQTPPRSSAQGSAAPPWDPGETSGSITHITSESPSLALLTH